jgi:hypothetical protein
MPGDPGGNGDSGAPWMDSAGFAAYQTGMPECAAPRFARNYRSATGGRRYGQ